MSAELPEAALALVRRTPLLLAPALGVRLKLENLQRTGSFKLRGATLALCALTVEERARGVVTASAGNHGQGVALAGARLGIATTVVVSAATPRVKRDAIAGLGAELLVRGAGYDEAEASARALAAERGARFVSAYDDDRVIAGNGAWLGREVLEQHPEARVVVAPVGGGGMIAGLLGELAPRGVTVIGVQTDANCAMHDSLAAERALTSYTGRAPTRCEGLEGAIAERTYRIARAHALSVKLVPESSVLPAMALAWRALGLALEPSAAVAIAALVEGAIAPSPDTVVVLSGGNVEPDVLDEALRS